jgi:acetyl esterase/lipase
VGVVAGLTYRGDRQLDVLAPVDGAGWPVVVVFHGGAWVAGNRHDIEPLAKAIAAQGAVVFNADYSTIPRGGGYPTSLQDAACAVAYAAENAAGFGGNPENLVVVGYSAGAHLGSIVALDPDRFADDCAGLAPPPTAFVGVAGPYDIRRIVGMALFFRAGPAAEPERWDAGDPFTYASMQITMPVHLIHGLEDRIADPGDSEAFASALAAAGHPVMLELLPGETHLGVVDPDRAGQSVLAAVRASTG